MHRATNLKMTELNPHLTCILCDGYFVDATTIVECLHSFCRACIVKYLETNKFCPVCDVQVHKTKPLLSLRSDKTLQDVVYKLVPRLYQNEMKRRGEFYGDHPEEAARCTSEERGEAAKQRFIYTPDETISLSLEYGREKGGGEVGNTESESEEQVPPKRYLQCPAAISVGHLKKFVAAKYAVPSSYEVEVSYSGDVLNEDYTLMDVAYIFAWRRSGPMRFFYRVKNRPIKRRKATHRKEEPQPPIPVIQEPEAPAEPEVPTLRLLPSPSAVPHEFKFVLKTVGLKKEDKPIEDQRSTEQKSKPSPTNPQSSIAAATTTTSGCTLEVPKFTIASAITQQPAIPAVVSSHNVISDNRATVSMLPTVVSSPALMQPIVCTPYAPLPQTKPPSKRATRSRVKNRTIHRPPLARLAPYPPPRTSSPSTNTLVPQVSHFPSTPVTCFTAPPATCLTTAPVNCLGTVSVSYLPNAPVTCFGTPPVNGTPGLNVSNLVPTAVSNGTISQLSTALVSSSCPQIPLNSISSSACTLPKTVVSSPASMVTTPTPNSTLSVESNLAAHSLPPTIPVAPKTTFCRSSRDSKSLKLVSSAEKQSVSHNKLNNFHSSKTEVLDTTCTPIVNNVPTSSHVVLAPSMPVIAMDVPHMGQNNISSIPHQPTSVNTVSTAAKKPTPSVSFSVNSLLPSVMSTQNTATLIPHSSNSSNVVLPAATLKSTDYISVTNPVEIPLKKAVEPPQLNGQNPITEIQLKGLKSPPVATEKNSINVPFKEVKSSITAEFSDNDDLGCQPDLVVDEQKIDSSDNEDETEESLRRKITAIAEKEDEVDVEMDTETDSGRASDISNQARSSCDDDIGSPSPATKSSESAQNCTTAATTLSNSFIQSPVMSIETSKPVDTTPSPSVKSNGIDHIINNLHRNHERKDNIGALDLSTSCRKPGEESSPRPRSRPVANPPVLDAKHRQQTCLSAPTKQHTACVPTPKHPTSSSFHVRALSSSAVRHGMLQSSATSPTSMGKIPPVTIPHFSPSSLQFPLKPPNSPHFCRTPQVPIHFQGNKTNSNSRQNKSTPRSNNCGSPSNTSHRKSPSASTPTNGRHDSLSPRQTSSSPTTMSPCVTPPKNLQSPTHLNSLLPSVPSTSSYKVSRPPIPIYKKSDTYKNSSHHNRFKGSNLTVINPDPNGYRQRIVIKNLDCLPGNHNSHHRL